MVQQSRGKLGTKRFVLARRKEPSGAERAGGGRGAGVRGTCPPQLYLLQAVPAAAYRERGETPGPHAGQPLPAGAGAAGAVREEL